MCKPVTIPYRRVFPFSKLLQSHYLPCQLRGGNSEKKNRGGARCRAGRWILRRSTSPCSGHTTRPCIKLRNKLSFFSSLVVFLYKLTFTFIPPCLVFSFSNSCHGFSPDLGHAEFEISTRLSDLHDRQTYTTARLVKQARGHRHNDKSRLKVSLIYGVWLFSWF